MKYIIVNFGRGVLLRKEASVRFVSDDRIEERRSEVRLIGGDSYGC